MKKSIVLFALILGFQTSINTIAQIVELQQWLAESPMFTADLGSQEFAGIRLSKQQTLQALKLFQQKKNEELLFKYEAQWNNKNLKVDTYQMPFYYQIFGSMPKDGRSLFISLHGGGGAPAKVNDRQFENQKHLYDKTMENTEGVYMALRAPTDSWNLWHQAHIDDFLNIIIQMAVIKENVNPNKVYILGYSAGGDGVYQLGPRMADRWAAASMMAGHPNDASPLNLKNTPFALHMGALDSAYNRNGVAAKWGNKLDSLESANPGTYAHQVQLHEGCGHWMKLEDSIAIPWMQTFERNPIPKSVVWQQDDRHHNQFYWLGTEENKIKTGGIIGVEYDAGKNEVNILENYSEEFLIYLNDNMVNLDEEVVVKYQGSEIFRGSVSRTIRNLYTTYSAKGDINHSFPAVLKVVGNKKVEVR